MASFQPNEATKSTNEASEFSTNMVFKYCEDLIDWVQKMGRSLGYIIIIRRRKIRASGLLTKVNLVCDRGGIYKSTKISSRNTGSKKVNCPFELKGKYSKLHDFWMLSVVCQEHNHEPAEYMEGHPYPGRLSDNETRLLADLSVKNVKPRDILSTLKKKNPENVSTLKTIYNAKHKIRRNEHAGNTEMQCLLSSLKEGGYIFYYRANNIMSNELEDLFFIHPSSLEIWRAFPQVMLMDSTYKTNKYNTPLLEIVGVSSTHLTFCIAFVFMHQEKEFNYTWALNCLKSTTEECLFPQVIVTDRELALMKACKNVFPDAKQLLCRWHICQSVWRKSRPSITSEESWISFNNGWTALVESPTDEAYNFNLAQLEKILRQYIGVRKYLNDVWLKPYKEKFISVWNERFLHFGNHTNNRAESQHSKLKLYLGTSKSDLFTCASFIHSVVQSQVTELNKV